MIVFTTSFTNVTYEKLLLDEKEQQQYILSKEQVEESNRSGGCEFRSKDTLIIHIVRMVLYVANIGDDKEKDGRWFQSERLSYDGDAN